MGGSSKSSESSSQSTETVSPNATGTVGDVIQANGAITITDNMPEGAVDVFKQLVSLAGQSLDTARQAGGAALQYMNENSKATQQPDVSLVESSNKTMMYLALALVGVAIWSRGK